MNINEVEVVTGLTRANIRYYEKEGLIEVERLDNKYRNYSSENIRELRKIVLLRRLGFSVDAIRKMKNSETDMQAELKDRIGHINSAIEEMQTAKAVCGKMIEDNAAYETLDPVKYMELFENRGTDVVSRDIIDEKGHPVRRFAAFFTDIFFYEMILGFIIVFCVRRADAVESMGIFFQIFSIIFMMLVEPLLLAKFGTTLGKRIFGIYVYNCSGDKISYRDGLYRCFYRLRWGLGFYIPIYILYRLYKSYKACDDSEMMLWDDENDSEVKVKDFSWKNILVWVISVALFFGGFVFSILFLSFPPNKGSVTPEQFVENYNYISKYRNFESLIEIQEDGKFIKVTPETDEHTIYTMTGVLEGDFYYKADENGYISEIGYEAQGSEPFYFNYWTNDEYSIMWALMMADENAFTYSETEDFILEAIENCFESGTYSYEGYTVSKTVESHGYEIVSEDGVMKDSDDGSFYIKWSISKTDA